MQLYFKSMVFLENTSLRKKYNHIQVNSQLS